MSDNFKKHLAKPTNESIAQTANKISEFFPIRQYGNVVDETQLTDENSSAVAMSSSQSAPVVVITYASPTGSYKLTFR
ncbi:hypothetical protein M3Y95_00365100 [Aphelenchoides besseyi]|nr:hypothetical protein M3Y95_00365100 [Aphelenchoides besseyi]